MRRLVVSDILKGLRKRKADNDEADMNYKTVGLIGLCSGAGTTQLGIMLANYFSNGLHLKTAIVSAGFDDSFDRIKEEEQVGKVRNYAGSRRGFSYKGIDFFGGVREGFVHVISEYYDVVIVEINLAGLKEKLAWLKRCYVLRMPYSCWINGSMEIWRMYKETGADKKNLQY